MLILKNNWVIDFIKRRKLECLGLISLGLISNFLTILIPVSVGKYYELLFHYNAHRAKFLSFLPEQIYNTIPRFMVFFGVLVCLRFLFFFLYRFRLVRAGEYFVKEVKDMLFSHQLKVSYNIYTTKGTGKYLLRYSGDINSLKNLFVKGSVSVLIDLIITFIAMAWLYSIHAKGAIIVILASVCSYAPVWYMNKKIETYSLQKRNKNSGQLSFVNRTLQAILSVLIFNKQKIEIKKYKKRTNAIKNTSLLYNKWLTISKGFITFIQYAVLLVIFYVFHLDALAHPGNNQGARLISFILLYITILPIIRRLYRLETVYKLGFISLNKLNKILELETEDYQNGRQLKINIPEVEFLNLSFPHGPALSFKTGKNKVAQITLPTSVGSLSLIHALTRTEENYSGAIRINKQDIKSFDLVSLRKNIAIISTQLPFVGRTVFESTTQSRSTKTKQKIMECLKKVQHHFPVASSLNIDNPIGENGVRIPNIQREILALVRGIGAGKKIILVDVLPSLEAAYQEKLLMFLESLEATVIKINIAKL